MKYHTLFCQKLEKMSQNLSSAAVMIGALRVKCCLSGPIVLFSEMGPIPDPLLITCWMKMWL